MPCFRLYYWSCNIRCFSFWCCARGAGWVEMEDQSCFPTSLKALIYSTLPTLGIKPKNPIVSHSLKIWTQIRKHFHWKECSVHAPLRNNHIFTPSLLDFTFNHWDLKGIHSIQDLFTNKIFSTFQQLQIKFGIHNKDFFKYLQVRSFVKGNFQSFPSQPPECMMNSILLLDPSKKGSISLIYNNLSQMDCTALDI